jgi:hypothetical protein
MSDMKSPGSLAATRAPNTFCLVVEHSDYRPNRHQIKAALPGRRDHDRPF